jgi:hypothetical protein
LDRLAVAFCLLCASFLISCGALLARHSFHYSILHGGADPLLEGGALLLQGGAGVWLLDGLTNVAGLVPARLLRLATAAPGPARLLYHNGDAAGGPGRRNRQGQQNQDLRVRTDV